MPEAEESLWKNAEWWAENRSSEQAQRWYEGFVEAITALGEHPQRYPLARESDRFPYDVRVMNYGISSHPTHRALYTIHSDAVAVISIRSARQRDATPDDLYGPDAVIVDDRPLAHGD